MGRRGGLASIAIPRVVRRSFRDAACGFIAVALIGVVPLRVAAAADSPPAHDTVNLAINPDGTAVWNGEPLSSEPELKARIAQRAQQSPKLQLDLQFHSVGSLNESNIKTLRDLIEMAAHFGYVHVETNGNGATLTVLGPAAGDSAPVR
jgi:hypothetical protein